MSDVVLFWSCKTYLFTEVLDRTVIVREPEERVSKPRYSARYSLEGRCVLSHAVHRTSLTRETLDEHANRHTTGERVRVDDDIWLHSRFTERHVDGRELLRANTLLTVTRRELVTDNR